MQLPKTKSYLLIYSLLIISTQLACQPIRKDKRITVASAGKITSLDPAQANTFHALQIISSLGDTLYIIDKKGELKPKLAKTLPTISSNGKKITIKIKENIRFHDGETLDAESIAFTIKRFKRIGTLNYVLGEKIKSIKAKSKYQLVIVLNEPSNSINGLLTSINLTPLSPKSYSKNKESFLNEKLIGTGPYKVTSFNSNRIRLEPFQDYWGKLPLNKGIDIINLSNSTSLYSALKTGEIDLLLSNSLNEDHSNSLSKMTGKGKIKEGFGPAMEIGYITFRTNDNYLKDIKLRKALLFSLDRRLISKRVSYGLRAPLYSIVPPILKQENSEQSVIWPNYDKKKFISLMQKAGYCGKNKINLELTYRSNVPADKLLSITWQEQIKRDFPNCLELSINGVESTTVYRQLSQGSFQSVILDWRGAYPDPEAYLTPLLSCKEIINNNCKVGESVASGSFWGSNDIQNSLKISEFKEGINRLKELNKAESYALDYGLYLPVWIVNPRAWSKKDISTPEFDNNGYIYLESLQKL